MSTSTLQLYGLIGKQVIIYGGIVILIVGALGAMLNTIVFSSLQTFRQNSCSFYLTIMSIVNIGQLLFGLISRILLTMYNNDGTEYSLFYCKFRPFIIQICTSMSWTCFCLATIDQYCATCSRRRLQQLCNIKLAQRILIVFSFIWICHTIPHLVFYTHILSPVAGKVTCTVVNTIYTQYRVYVIGLGFSGFLPVFVSAIFGLMAYINVQRYSHYTIPLVRHELDKQLTAMVLVALVINCFTVLPFTIANVFLSNINTTTDPFVAAQIQLTYSITLIVSYLYFASPFYVYICVSERFRRQLIYVLVKIYYHRFQTQVYVINNQVAPA